MSSRYSKTSIIFKRGDDFKLDFTVQDTNNDVSIAYLATLATAKELLIEAQKADPLVQQDVDDATAAVALAQAQYDASVIVDITNWSMLSQVRRFTKKIADMVIVIIDAPTGRFSVTCPAAQTQLWPVQKLECDVEFTRPAGKVSSDTFTIDVQRDITQ
mgnify:CR=1 FL=1